MLTAKAEFERRWQGLPVLAKVIGDAELSEDAAIRLYGRTSVSDNVVEVVSRLLHVSALATDQKGTLIGFVATASPRQSEDLMMELRQLANRLREFAVYLDKQLASEIEELQFELSRNRR